MSGTWEKVRFSEVLHRAHRFEPRDDLREYLFAGTYSFARGIFVGERKLGSTFSLPKVQRIRAGDFVYCKIMAWEGAFGVVPKEADGCVMSSAFVVYELNRQRIDSKFLDYFFKVPVHWRTIGTQSTGTNVRRQSLHPDQFEKSEISLPSLPEQRRIVAQIEELAAKINEARTLRQEGSEEAMVLLGTQLGSEFGKLAKRLPVKSLGDLTSHIVDGPHVTPTYLLDGVTGIPFVTVKNMVSGKLDFSDINYISEDDHSLFTKRCRAERGDVLYSKDGATRGRPCLVDTDQEFSFFVSVALIKPLRDQLDGRYLVHLLNSNWTKDRMVNKSRGDMIPHIVLREIRDFPVPLPPLSEQCRIVAELDALQAQVDALKKLQVETDAELNALLPSILDKAFRGDL